MSATPPPVTETEMADIIRRALMHTMGDLDLSLGPSGAEFDYLTLATDQQFRVTVREVKP